jgi:ABC-2 type transport system permease protein
VRAPLFFRVVSLEARTRMSYRVDFWLNAVVAFAAQLAVLWFLWAAIFAESDETVIGGYTFDGMIVYYLAATLLGKVIRGREFETFIAQDIYEGGLNRYLVFPARYFPFKYAQNIGRMAPQAVQVFLFAAIVLFAIDLPPEMRPTAGGVARAAAAVALANLLHFILSFPVQCVAFWADNVWSLEVAKRLVVSLLGGALVPLTVFPRAVQEVLYVLPFRLFADVPVRTLLGEIGPREWAMHMGSGVVWCLWFGLIARLVWGRGNLQYTGIGM